MRSKIWKSMTIAAITVTVFGLLSCIFSSDPERDGRLVGCWKELVPYDNSGIWHLEFGNSGDYLCFKLNGIDTAARFLGKWETSNNSKITLKISSYVERSNGALVSQSDYNDYSGTNDYLVENGKYEEVDNGIVYDYNKYVPAQCN